MATKADPEMAPDPDEDDLSDLDDVLEEFSATKITDKKPPASAAPVGPSTTSVQAEDALKPNDEFSEQLQAGMAELLGQFQSNPEMQQEFQNMMKELGEAAKQEGAGALDPEPSASATARSGNEATAKPKKAGEDSFQETIRKTMDRMQNSGDAASAAAATADEDDMLAKMLKEMEGGNFPGLDGDGGEDFNKMLMGMMEQLTNKEILYEPMKDLHDKYPGWLEGNRNKVNKADLDRYIEQQSLVDAIVARFERQGYSDENKEDRDFIVDKMQKMQAAGSPPPDLVGDMGAAQEMLSDPEAGCPQQ